ncbi:LamG domain-containing protein, partial [Victivallis vadensis]|uniref:LamG domain-containing protein n=1 Tax=Victivallis vadensis TaxID=172901 RepID=UPI0023F83BCA
MQNLIFYVSAASTLGVAKDSLGVKNVALPTIIRGGEVCLKMRLFAGDGDDTPLPLDELTRCTAWEWAMDSDFDESTNYKLVADNANITVGSVTETDPEGVEHTYTEISIPIPATNTEELKEWLGTSESQNNLNGELAGYDATGKLTYILQLKGFTIRNRILSAGDPTELPEQYLDEAGVRALIGAGAEAQCATAADAPDGDWVDSTTAPDTHVWIRWRLRGNPSGAWSTPAKRLPGPAGATGDKGDKGDTGATGLVEIVSIEMTAPATSPSITEAEGSTAEHRKYILHIPRGEKGDTGTDGTDGADGAAAGFGTPTVTVETLPAGSDATASVTASGDDTAKIFNFNFGIPKGADGSGTGDMTKSVYDTNDDGIVDHAATADAVGATTAAQVADAVGKAHTHANKATLDKLAETDGKLTFDGAEIGGASNWNDITGKPSTFPPSAHNHAITDVTGLEDALQKAGTVKSVNGQLPDESGNVTVETGGAVDESRLLPETGSVSSDSVGNPVIFKAISRIDNTYWLCLPLNEDTNDRSTYDVATEVYGTVNIVSNAPSSPGGSAFFNGSSCLHGTLPAQFGTSDFTVRLWMMAPAISSGSSSHTIFSTRRGNQTDADTFALLCTTEGRLYIYSDGSITSYGTDTPFALQSGVWYHVAVVRKSGVLTIYVNSEVYSSATFTNSLTRQIFGLGASWTGSSYSEAGTVYLTSLDVLNYAAYDGAFTTPAYQPGILAGAGYEVATDDEVKNMLSTAGIDESRLLPENPANGDIPCFDATATIGGGNDANTRILLHFDADEIKDEAAGNAAPVTITKKTGTITVVEGGKWGKCAKYVTGSMTVATNLDE